MGSSDPMSIHCQGTLISNISLFMRIKFLLKGSQVFLSALSKWKAYSSQWDTAAKSSCQTQNKFKTLESSVYIFHGHQNKHITLCWSWDLRGHFCTGC